VKAVRYDEYGGVDVLNVVDVPRPVPGPGQVLVQVKAAGINPGEAKIREGLLHARWPATFPSGQGSDLAGVVAETGPGVTGAGAVAVGDEVIGYTDNRASQAEYVLVEAANLTPRPPALRWEVAGSLFVVGATAYAAVRAVALASGDTVVVSGAAGGVGSLVVQLAKLAGATVIGLASPRQHEWLISHGVVPVTYGEGVADRIRQAASRVDAFIDTVGADYVDLALELGVKPDRVDTIVNFPAVAAHGVKAEGNAAGASATTLAELAGLIVAGRLELPVAATFPLARVRDAYRRLAEGHTRGKIVLLP
jgi:NADPH:quinone reductase-like Zn-dependent oxidoreductase